MLPTASGRSSDVVTSSSTFRVYSHRLTLTSSPRILRASLRALDPSARPSGKPEMSELHLFLHFLSTFTKGVIKVNLLVYARALQLIKQVVNSWKWIMVLSGYFAKFAVIGRHLKRIIQQTMNRKEFRDSFVQE
ncbi:hypothetical protein Tco_0172521 [Tanacetum coccineum]